MSNPDGLIPHDAIPRTRPRPKRAIWVDAFGQKYEAESGDYIPGQFSPTGSRMVRFLPDDDSRLCANYDAQRRVKRLRHEGVTE